MIQRALHVAGRRCLVATGLMTWLLAVSGQPAVSLAADLAVDIDFSGGSAVVEAIDQERRTIKILPSDHPGRGWRCWWYIHVTGIKPGETITLDVGGGVWATPDQATYSTDHKTWLHTAPGKRDGQRIVYQQKIDANEAWFAWGPPFVPEDAKRLVESAAARTKGAEVFNLCQTRENRETPALKLSPPDGSKPKFGIWIQARQHAWESGSSWVCQGLLEWLISDDPLARQLRVQSLIVVVPVMDIDNVAIGAGGKNERPHDHNRDWTDTPHWRAVAAAQQAILQMDKNETFDIFLDLHNPAPNDRQPFFFAAPKELLKPEGRENLARFLAIAKEQIQGPLPFKGMVRESGTTYDRNWQAISKNWVTVHCRPHVVAITLETSWNTPGSTTEGYLSVGQGLGRTVGEFLLKR